MELPVLFENRMKQLLGDEYDSFRGSYERNRSYGLRINPLKGSSESLRRASGWELKQVPWAEEGYYYDPETRPGKHPLHDAGAFYIQEPSAMSIAAILDPKPGECILDLCAAPGGKTTQIAGRMNGEGLLVSNEIVPSRAKDLSQNVERMGIRNCVVLVESPDRLESIFPLFFDGIVVDAPCSGEGMFRKEEIARTEWSPAAVEVCISRQRDILRSAVSMLKPGGRLVYSTCTFEPGEDEETVQWLLDEFPQMKLVTSPLASYFSKGLSGSEELDQAVMRLWPHKLEGEGHFAAIFQKDDSERPLQEKEGASNRKAKGAGNGKGSKESFDRKELLRFLQSELGLSIPEGKYISFGNQIYLLPEELKSLDGIRCERPGLCLAQWTGKRFEPSHALALSIRPGETEHFVNLTLEQASAYLRGESVFLDAIATTGWIVVAYEGYSLGFGKVTGNQIKNHYPKGLRRRMS